MVEFTVLI